MEYLVNQTIIMIMYIDVIQLLEEMMSLICTLTNDISTLYCNILTYDIVLLQLYLLMY